MSCSFDFSAFSIETNSEYENKHGEHHAYLCIDLSLRFIGHWDHRNRIDR